MVTLEKILTELKGESVNEIVAGGRSKSNSDNSRSARSGRGTTRGTTSVN